MPSTRLAFLSRGTLAHLAPTFDSPRPSGCQAGLDPIADQIAFKLGQAGHDGAHQLATGVVEIEAEARLSQDADFPAVKIFVRPSRKPIGTLVTKHPSMLRATPNSTQPRSER
jgi:hypothetical protein